MVPVGLWTISANGIPYLREKPIRWLWNALLWLDGAKGLSCCVCFVVYIVLAAGLMVAVYRFSFDAACTCGSNAHDSILFNGWPINLFNFINNLPTSPSPN